MGNARRLECASRTPLLPSRALIVTGEGHKYFGGGAQSEIFHRDPDFTAYQNPAAAERF